MFCPLYLDTICPLSHRQWGTEDTVGTHRVKPAPDLIVAGQAADGCHPSLSAYAQLHLALKYLQRVIACAQPPAVALLLTEHCLDNISVGYYAFPINR